MTLVEPQGSFPYFAGGFPSELGGRDSGPGGSNLHIIFCFHNSTGPFGGPWLANIRVRTAPRSWTDHEFRASVFDRPHRGPTRAERLTVLPLLTTNCVHLRQSRSVLESTSFEAYDEHAGTLLLYPARVPPGLTLNP